MKTDNFKKDTRFYEPFSFSRFYFIDSTHIWYMSNQQEGKFKILEGRENVLFKLGGRTTKRMDINSDGNIVIW